MKINILKTLYFLGFLFTFLPMFVIYIIPHTNANVVIYTLIFLVLYGLLLITKLEQVKLFISKLLKLQITKYYLLFIGFICIEALIHILSGHYKAPTDYYIVRFYKFFIITLLIFTIPVTSLFFNIKPKTILKLLYIFSYFLCILGIIQYIGIVNNISFIDKLFDFLTNCREMLYADINVFKEQIRIFGVFNEPAAFAKYIYLTAPILLNLTFSNFKIINNKYLNLFVKSTMFPLMIISVFIIKSAMYIPLTLIEFTIIIIIIKKDFIKKNLGILLTISCLIMLILFLILSNFISHTNILMGENINPLTRIFKTLEVLSDYNTLLIVEPSLAARIYSYSMQLIAFNKNILFGCGLCNVMHFVNSFFRQEYIFSIPMEHYIPSMFNNVPLATLNTSVVYTSLAEYGIIGFGFLVAFYKKCLTVAKSCMNHLC